MTWNVKKTLGFILLLVLILRIPSYYTYIMDVDESQYGEFAIKVVNGEKPYVSSIGEKPPLMYYFFVWIFKAFGKNNYPMIHVVTALWVALTALFVFLIARLRFGESVAIAATMLYAIFSTTHEPKIISTNGETLMNLPLVMGIYFFTLYEIRGRSMGFLFLTGVFSGIGLLFRHQAGMQMAFLGGYFLLVYVILDREGVTLKGFARRTFDMMILTVSWLLPLVTAVLILKGMGDDVLEQFIFWNFTFNFKYIAAGSKGMSWSFALIRISIFVLFTVPVWYYLFRGVRLIIPGLIGKIRERMLENTHRNRIFLILWLVMSFLPVFVGGRFYSHYFVQFFPAFFVAGALGMSYLFQHYDESSSESVVPDPRRKKVFITLALFAILCFIPRVDADFTKSMIKKLSPHAGKLGATPEQKLVGQYIREHTKPSDRVLIWGFATSIYVYADREAGSRFSWTDFLSGRIPGLPPWEERRRESTNYYILDECWDWFCQDLVRYQPVYFVDSSPGGHHEYGQYPITKRYSRYDLSAILKEYYVFEKDIEGYHLYRRKKTIKLSCKK